MRKSPFPFPLFRAMSALLLILCLLLFSGCNRNWPKFWQPKPITGPIEFDPKAWETLAFDPQDIPPPAALLPPDMPNPPVIDPNFVPPDDPGEAILIPLKVGPAPGDETKEVSELQIIYFDYNSKALSPEMREKVAQNARWILKYASDTHINIEGHADERGTEEYNTTLSEYRAATVRVELVKHGVNPDLLHPRGLGENRPVDPGSNEAAWSKNRRVQFLVHF